MATQTGLSKNVIYKRCKFCGKKYLVADRPTSAYCCEAHRKFAFKHKSTDKILNRPYTSDTRFLIQKWHHEGMDLIDICAVLNRSKENVLQALGGVDKSA